MVNKMYLIFKGKPTKCICIFNSQEKMDKFICSLSEKWFNKLPEVDPRNEPIPYFETPEEALKYFEVI